MSDKKTIFNMPGDELESMLKRLSRYTLVVELVALAACVPMFTGQFFLLISLATILMYFDCLFMLICQERKQGIWKYISRIQLIIAVINSVCIALCIIKSDEGMLRIMTVISYVFIWGHNILCFIENRKDEEIPFMRHIGAFIIIVTIVVCLIAKNVLLDLGISF